MEWVVAGWLADHVVICPLLFHLPLDQHSFPSGHATRVGGLVVVLGVTLPCPWALALTLWALSVGISRVVLRAHFASDIVAGWGLGVALGCILLACWF